MKPIPKRKAPYQVVKRPGAGKPPTTLRGQGPGKQTNPKGRMAGLKLFVFIQPNPNSRVGQGIHAEVLCKDLKQAKELFAKRLKRTPPSNQIFDWSDCISKWDHIRNLQPGVVRTLKDVLNSARLHLR